MQSLQSATNGAAKRGNPVGADRCAGQVLDSIPPAIRAIRRMMRSNRLAGLSVPQFRAMAMLRWSPNATLSSVADHIGTSPPAASRMIDGLVAKGLVQREQSGSDRREVSLALTPRGSSEFCQARQATRRQLAQRLADLGPEKRVTLLAGLDVLAEVFGSDSETRPIESVQ